MNSKKENENNKADDFLEYILINHKNIIEELNDETKSKQKIEFSNSLLVNDSNDFEKNINKLFNQILPESKEEDPLKVNIAISNKMNKIKDKKNIINQSINDILNKEENTNIVLTSDLSENISNILCSIFHKIKKKNKIKTYDQFIQQINKCDSLKNNILQKFLVQKGIGSESAKNNIKIKPDIRITENNTNKYIFIDNNNIIENYKYRNTVQNLNLTNTYNNDLKLNNVSKKFSNDNLINPKRKTSGKIDNNIRYEYDEKKYNDKSDILPVEIHILRRKFQNIKKMKLILYSYNSNNCNNSTNNFRTSSSNNLIYSPNNSTLNKDENSINCKNSLKTVNNLTLKDVQNNIYILLNMSWLFPELLELEIDLTNDNIIKDQIILYKEKLKLFSKKIGQSLKSVYYPPPDYLISNQKKILESRKGSIFTSFYLLNNENSSLNDDESFSLRIQEDEITHANTMTENNRSKPILLEDNVINESEKFFTKYKPTLQMIIIYGFFISKLTRLLLCSFTIPFNLEAEIKKMLKTYKIVFPDFHFMSFLSNSKINIFQITLEFNSLDPKIFKEVINLFFMSNNLRVCRFNFFPEEYYLQPEILYKLLEDIDQNFKNLTSKNFAERINKHNKYKLKPNEELDDYLLRKLIEYFENNMNNFFQALILKSSLNELSLLFDIPNLLNKNDYFILIIIKFLLNLFILIEDSKLNLLSLILQGKNLPFDNRRFPFLSNFFDQINIYNNKKIKINSFTFQVYFSNINNIYRIIPYNICELSIGEFDYETFAYFTEFITSREFSLHSNLNKLQINLNSNFLIIDDNVYSLIIKLFTEYPKGLKELAFYTFFNIKYKQLKHLLLCTNYNTIENIFLSFDRRSLFDDSKYGNLIELEVFNNADADPVVIDSEKIVNKEKKFLNLFYVKRNVKKKFICNSIMAPIANKYNNQFMDYNIYMNLEKFINPSQKKKYIIQFKLNS